MSRIKIKYDDNDVEYSPTPKGINPFYHMLDVAMKELKILINEKHFHNVKITVSATSENILIEYEDENKIIYSIEENWQVQTERGLVSVCGEFETEDEALAEGFSYSFCDKKVGKLYSKCLDSEGKYHAFVIVK